MKKLVILLLLCVSFVTAQEENPAEAVVQKQVEAYNAQNLEEFLETYSDDIEIYDFPNTLSIKGKEEFRKRCLDYFKKYPDLHCEILNRTIQGNTIIDQERILEKKGTDYIEVIAIYTIENHKIAKIHFIEN